MSSGFCLSLTSVSLFNAAKVPKGGKKHKKGKKGLKKLKRHDNKSGEVCDDVTVMSQMLDGDVTFETFIHLFSVQLDGTVYEINHEIYQL